MNANDAPAANGRTEVSAPEVTTPTLPTETPVPATRPTPFTAARRMMEDFDRLLEDWSFGKEWLAPVFGRDPLVKRFEEFGKADYLPDVEITQKDDTVTVRADLPGMKKEDIDVEVKENSVILKGERRQETEERKNGYYRSERSYGSFYRNVPLPATTIPDSAKASLTDGVLEVTVKVDKPNGRKVEVS